MRKLALKCVATPKGSLLEVVQILLELLLHDLGTQGRPFEHRTGDIAAQLARTDWGQSTSIVVY